jgi:hypothetical protein
VGGDDRARFILADLFAWRPERRYDVVFFGFWLSHVPLERFAEFWALVDECLAPHGRVLFVDDAYRTPDELIEGEASTTIRRRSSDGKASKIIKVPHVPAALEPVVVTRMSQPRLLRRGLNVHPSTTWRHLNAQQASTHADTGARNAQRTAHRTTSSPPALDPSSFARLLDRVDAVACVQLGDRVGQVVAHGRG